MNKKLKFQFLPVPYKMLYALDNNCLKVLLILMAEYKQEDGSILINRNFLAEKCGMTLRAIRMAITALQDKEIITTSRKIHHDDGCFRSQASKYHINYSKFEEYNKYSVEEIITNKDLWIHTC